MAMALKSSLYTEVYSVIWF